MRPNLLMFKNENFLCKKNVYVLRFSETRCTCLIEGTIVIDKIYPTARDAGMFEQSRIENGDSLQRETVNQR